MERVDYSNVLKMADLLQKKTAYTSAYVHLVSLMYHCLLIPGEPASSHIASCIIIIPLL